MEALYFTLAGIALYLAADWLVQQTEIAAGRRFEYRSLYFFAVLLALALVVFACIRAVTE